MINLSRRLRFIALPFVLIVILAACGQKPGVHATAVGAVGAPTGGAIAPVPGSTNTGVPVPGQTAGGVPVPGQTQGSGPSNQPTVGPNVPGGPQDRTGITATKITIGIHAPATGAAPVSADAFKAGKDLYWNFLKSKGEKVYGRDVEVLFADDQYTPTTAVSVCNQMATQGHAFLLIGGAGADQIGACANFANQHSIPYLSPGVQTSGLDRLNSYFAVTMTYAQQIPLLMQLLKKKNAKQSLNKYGDAKIKVGFVRPDTGNFDNAEDAFRAEAPKAGFDSKVYVVAKEGNTSDSQSVATAMQQDGVDVVFPITAPTFTTQLAIQTGKNGYTPRYAGIGITNNINQMIDTVCKSNSAYTGATFLSPWPGWKQLMAGKYDPDFKKAAATDPAAKKFNTRNGGGDILLALWGIMKTVHKMFLAAGKDMSRQSFITSMGSFKLHTGMFPDLQYSASNHFGASNMNVLRGNCDEAGDGGAVSAGAQYVDDPDYPGLHSTF